MDFYQGQRLIICLLWFITKYPIPCLTSNIITPVKSLLHICLCWTLWFACILKSLPLLHVCKINMFCIVYKHGVFKSSKLFAVPSLPRVSRCLTLHISQPLPLSRMPDTNKSSRKPCRNCVRLVWVTRHGTTLQVPQFGRTEQWCLYRRTLNAELLFAPWEAKLHF